MKGLLAFDIDKTLTCDPHSLPPEVETMLCGLAEDGWQLAFLTGRTYSFGFAPLNTLPFPFYFGVQNGAALLSMPARQVLYRRYIPRARLSALDRIFQGRSIGYLVEGGTEDADRCYYRRDLFTDEDLVYLAYREELARAPFVPVASASEVPLESFPLIKIFGRQQELEEICGLYQAEEEVESAIVGDPFRPGGAIALLTERGVDKADALRYLSHALSLPVTLTAGDDENDIGFVQLGKERIVMATAPHNLKRHATLLAGSAADRAIVEAVQQALKRQNP